MALVQAQKSPLPKPRWASVPSAKLLAGSPLFLLSFSRIQTFGHFELPLKPPTAPTPGFCPDGVGAVEILAGAFTSLLCNDFNTTAVKHCKIYKINH